jgi:hypothetical protein
MLGPLLLSTARSRHHSPTIALVGRGSVAAAGRGTTANGSSTAVGAAAFCCFICSAASAATGRTSSATTVVLVLGVQLPWSMRTVLGSLAAVRSRALLLQRAL